MRLAKVKSEIPEDVFEYNEVSKDFEKAAMKPARFESLKEASKELLKELELLAAKHETTIEKLLIDAESSGKLNPDYVQALMLARRISYFKRKVK